MMDPLQLSAIEYQTPERQRRLDWPTPTVPLALALLQVPWLVVGAIGFYFFAPTVCHYFVYDSAVGRVLLFLALGSPAIIGCFVGVRAICRYRNSGVGLLGLMLALVGLLVCGAFASWILLSTVINPTSPYQPGYWL